LAERGLCKPEVRGSNPLASTKLSCDAAEKVSRPEQPRGRVEQLMLTAQIGWLIRPPEVEHSKQSK
jgi:hypothetical protein